MVERSQDVPAHIAAGKASHQDAQRESEHQYPRPWVPSGPTRISEAQLAALRKMHERFTRRLQNDLSQLLHGTQLRIEETKDAAQVYYEDFVTLLNLDQNTAESYVTVIFTMDQPSARHEESGVEPVAGGSADLRFVIAYDRRLVFSVIDRIMGGSGRIVIPTARGLTDIEDTALKRFTETVREGLEYAWRYYFNDQLAIRAADARVAIGQVALPGEFTVNMTFRVGTGGNEVAEAGADALGGLLVIGYPYTLLEPIRTELSPTRVASRTRTSEVNEEVRAHLERLDFELDLSLGDARLPAGRVARLQRGDVLHLDTEVGQPLKVYIDRYPRFLASIGVRRQRVALRVEKVLDLDEQESPPMSLPES